MAYCAFPISQSHMCIVSYESSILVPSNNVQKSGGIVSLFATFWQPKSVTLSFAQNPLLIFKAINKRNSAIVPPESNLETSHWSRWVELCIF